MAQIRRGSPESGQLPTRRKGSGMSKMLGGQANYTFGAQVKAKEFTPPRPSEMSEKKWSTKAKLFLTSNL